MHNSTVKTSNLVFMKEPYIGKFTNLDNVVLTPHIGSYSQEIRSTMEKEALNMILKRFMVHPHLKLHT